MARHYVKGYIMTIVCLYLLKIFLYTLPWNTCNFLTDLFDSEIGLLQELPYSYLQKKTA